MLVRVDPKSGVPIFRQIMREIKAAIARGVSGSGQVIPSVRQMASRALVNPNTVARAYRELERDGILYTRPGLGVFVSSRARRLCRNDCRSHLEARLQQIIAEALRAGLSSKELRQAFGQAVKGRAPSDEKAKVKSR